MNPFLVTTASLLTWLVLLCLQGDLSSTTMFVEAQDDLMPQLPFGDINVLVVTDVHSFIGGHRHEQDRNADFGDVLSFYQRLKAYCDQHGADLWFVMNGDWNHGTGLAIDGNATQLVPLLNQMPWDIINVGNHECYQNAIVEIMRDEMIPHFGQDKILASNTFWRDTMEPFGGRYKLLQGVNNTVLVFGFMYNLHNPSQLLTVSHVDAIVQQDWFRNALEDEKYDAVLVMAHMGNTDPLLQTILAHIRSYAGENIPVQFITGHTHKRQEDRKDVWSHAMESGGDMDTIGFVSFPSAETAKAVTNNKQAKNYFKYQFLNASKIVLKNTLWGTHDEPGSDVSMLQTEAGVTLTQQIKETQKRLGLNVAVGCAPQNYYRDRTIYEKDSIWKLWIDHVVPTQICKLNRKCVFLTSSNIFRYDIITNGKQDPMTVDDVVTVAPLMQPVVYVGEVPDWVLLRMNSSLNTQSFMRHDKVPEYVFAGVREIEDRTTYSLYTHEFNVPEITHDLNRLNQQNMKFKRTGDRDTLYWLKYIEEAWPCPNQREPKDVQPWFKNIKALEEEKGDGHESFDDEEIGGGSMDEGETNHVDESATPQEDLHYSGYQGYIPANTINKYKDVLPEDVTPHEAQKPTERPVVVEEENKHKTPKHSSGAANKQKNKERRKKIKRTFIKVFASVITIAVLLLPLSGLYSAVKGRDNKDDMRDMMMAYDPEEMRSLKRGKKKQKKNQRFFKRSEIEIT